MDLACTVENRCYVPGYEIIPPEYSGWIFLMFMIIGFVCILYGLYYITIDPIPNQVFVRARKRK